MKNNIDVPFHVYAERDIPGKNCIVEEFDEYITVNGVKISKPLVEKPVDADDHNVFYLIFFIIIHFKFIILTLQFSF